MAKKEKIQIQRDKRMEPIDNDLDAAMGLLDDRNKQITDLLASFAPPAEVPADAEEPAVEGDKKAPAAKAAELETSDKPEPSEASASANG